MDPFNASLPLEASDLNGMAKALVRRLYADCVCETPQSSISESIYNTAWVSMIPNPSRDAGHWLFPRALDFVIGRQLANGGWSSMEPAAGRPSWATDSIINTMACLLALLVRKASVPEAPNDLDERITRADGSLRQMLRSWDIASLDHVGFEVLVPAHLEMLERYKLQYEFPARPALFRLYQHKMNKIKPESLYEKELSTSLYCLEGMIGKIDFDRVAHHKVDGCMLGNPASTAAYLMNTSVWDVEAEMYLRKAMPSDGAVEFYPPNLFEITWALRPLVEAFPMDALMSLELRGIADFTEKTFQAQKGFVGSAPETIEDSDSTSSTIYLLNRLGCDVTAEAMISRYESSDKFRCYAVERTPSPTANAHVLKMLLQLSDSSRNTSRIMKVADYICDCWWQGDQSDKWNLTPHYVMMVSVQSLVMLLHGWDRGSLPEIPIELLKNRVIPVLFGVTVETLQKQNPDGSWGFQSCETTAYAILCLSEVAALPLCDCLLPTIQLAVKNGRTFLMQQISRWKEPDKVWISKIAFGAGVVTEAYTLAAMKISPGNRSFGKGIGDLCKITKPSLSTVQEISHLPFFAGMPDWLVGACIVEAYLHLPIYDKVRRAVMTHEVKQQRPFNITPFVLIASSRSAGAFIAPDVNIEFMVLIALTYEVDHYMEDIIGGWKETEVQQVANIVGEIFDEPWIELPKPRTNRTLKDGGSNAQPPGHLDVVEDTLRPAISWVLNHPKVRSSSRYDQAILRREFRALYLGNITSIYESADLATSRQLPRSPTLVREPYHHWVHGTSSAHIAGPAVFAFLTCLLGPRTDGRDCFPGPEAKYFAQDLSMHLSSLARMENDIGSAVRDRKEHNLNSIDFAEFDPGSPPEHGDDDLQARLAHLRRLASYERECSRMALAKLRAVGVGERAMQWLQAFCNAIDLFGQIYATEDISPTLQRCS